MDYIKSIRKKIGHDPIFAPAAGCIIIRNNKILLQKRIDDETWALHGGYLDLGESFFEAMERKLKKEINIKPINPKLINIYSGKNVHDIYPNGDEVYGIVAIYLATDFEGQLEYDPIEVMDLKWFDIDSLPKNLHTVDVEPIKDAILLYKSKL